MTARILIIEDEAVVAMELGFLLEDLGHEVVGFATDSRSALTHAERGGLDLALVDIHLADGPTGVQLGKTLAQRFGVSVLFITANPSMVQGDVAGAVGVLTKPTDDRAVQKAVKYALARRLGPPPAPPPPPEMRLLG